MQKKTCSSFGFLVLIVFLLTSCIQSPLFNHADASLSKDRQGAQEQVDCPLLFSKENLCASLSWIKMPTEEEQGEFILRFWNREEGTESGPYVDPGYTVFVNLWMPSMGHGSSPTKTAPVKDASGAVVPGLYSVTDVYFIMPGAWQIIVQLKAGSQVIDQAVYDVQI